MKGSRARFLALWAMVALAKLVLAASLPLFGDEAFYAWEGRHLAPAYADLPGLTAWLTALGAMLPLPDDFALRLPFVLVGLGLPFGVVQLALRLGEPPEGAWQAGTLSLLLPLALALGPLALPDVLLAAATLLCLSGLAGLLREGRGCLLLALGLVVGGLAHYRFALLLPLGLLGLLATAAGRRLLLRPGVVAALLAGALAWGPLLAFNLAHGGAGLGFQFIERHPFDFDALGLTQAPQQLLLVTPGLALLLVLAALGALRRDVAPGHRLVAVAAGGLLLVLAVLAPFVDRERVSFHWPLPAWLALCALAPPLLASTGRLARAAVFWPAAAGLLLMAAGMALTSSAAGRAWLDRHALYPDNFGGWDVAAAETRAALARLPGVEAVVADNFMLAAQLRHALPEAMPVYSLDHPLNDKHGRTLQLALWGRDAEALRALPEHSRLLLVVEPGASRPARLLALYHHACEVTGAIGPFQGVLADGGAKRFLLAPARREDGATCVTPALAWIDRPSWGSPVGRDLVVEGWAFKDGASVREAWVTLDGRPVSRVDYGLDAPKVAGYWSASQDPAHPHVGWTGRLDLSAHPPGEVRIGLLVYGADGSREPVAGVRVRVAD